MILTTMNLIQGILPLVKHCKLIKKIEPYIENTHVSLVSEQEAMKLDVNLGESAIELGEIFDVDLLMGHPMQIFF